MSSVMEECHDNSDESDDDPGEDEAGGRDGDDETGGGLDLTSFLFGNIDQAGQLEGEFLDESTKKQLGSLGNMLSDTNLNSIVDEVSTEAKEGIKDLPPDAELEDAVDFTAKAPDAEDFSTIEEAMDDDDDDSSSDEDVEDDKETVQNGVKDDASVTAVAAPTTTVKAQNDSFLMPPPPTQPATPISTLAPAGPAAEPRSADPTSAPLAGMLPDKYKDCDVKAFFPEFKENSVLRFSKLFPIKESHKPRTWKALKKRRRKELGGEEGGPSGEKRKRGWGWKPPLPIDPAAYMECQSVRFHKPAVLEQNGRDQHER